MVYAFYNLGPVSAGGQWSWLFPGQVIEFRHAKATDLQDIPEAFCGDKAGLNSPVFENCVCGDSGAVDHFGYGRTGDVTALEYLRQTFGYAAAVVVRCRRYF